ncbi:MAG: hypothetical protein Kow0099_04110 [Candidatus Abyssubacteria bacterium]
MSLKRIALGIILLAAFLGAVMYLLVPDYAEGRVRATRVLMRISPSSFYRELAANFRPLSRVASYFYLSQNRMPALEQLQLEASPTGHASVWGEYLRQRYGDQSYYHYGFDKGECTFVVETTGRGWELDQHFYEYILPILSGTMTDFEHEWIIKNVESSRYPPEYLVFQSIVASSMCLELVNIMKVEAPDRYEEIRNELLKEMEEGTYEKICVFSKPFQEKLARRREQDQALKEANTEIAD